MYILWHISGHGCFFMDMDMIVKWLLSRIEINLLAEFLFFSNIAVHWFNETFLISKLINYSSIFLGYEQQTSIGVNCFTLLLLSWNHSWKLSTSNEMCNFNPLDARIANPKVKWCYLQTFKTCQGKKTSQPYINLLIL